MKRVHGALYYTISLFFVNEDISALPDFQVLVLSYVSVTPEPHAGPRSCDKKCDCNLVNNRPIILFTNN